MNLLNVYCATAEYSFSTLTLSGEAIPAYSVDRSPTEVIEHVKLAMPVVLTLLIVLLALTVVCVLKQKTQPQGHLHDLSATATPNKLCEGTVLAIRITSQLPNRS